MTTLDLILDYAKTDLHDEFAANPDSDPGDIIFEIADSHTPVYDTVCLQIAADNLAEIGCRGVDIVGYDENTPARAAQLAIFDYIREELWKTLDKTQ